uniref:(northern house mosquito) hypothetical protein n=1 Tax=Culex pipiens TaxID=7175 RepID=A0A8D8F2F6_CULPI
MLQPRKSCILVVHFQLIAEVTPSLLHFRFLVDSLPVRFLKMFNNHRLGVTGQRFVHLLHGEACLTRLLKSFTLLERIYAGFAGRKLRSAQLPGWRRRSPVHFNLALPQIRTNSSGLVHVLDGEAGLA